MANIMDIAVVALLFLSALLPIASANDCPHELTKPNQVIDVDQSKGLKQFDDIGALHVDGETEEDRLKECVDLCCHAGAGCNVVSLDKAIKGKDGDNCHLFKCDPPEDCKWTIKEDFQSALLSSATTTTDSSVKTTSASDTKTKEPTTVADSDITTTDSSDITTGSLQVTTAKSITEKGDAATTEATATTAASEGTTAESSAHTAATTEGSHTTTEAPATTESKKGKEKEDVKASANSTETTTVQPKKNVTDAGEKNLTSTETTTEKPMKTVTGAGDKNLTDSIGNSTTKAPLDATTQFRTTTATTKVETTPKKRVLSNSTATPNPNEDTTVLIQSTNTSLAPTTSIGAFDSNDTQTPAPLRAKTADMSSNTVTALACALAAGAMFVGVIATIIGKRFYDNWHRRHYQQIDYLVDGIDMKPPSANH